MGVCFGGALTIVVFAGSELFTGSNFVLSLAENPDQLSLLRARPELLPSAIEETIRYRSPVQWMFRGTKRSSLRTFCLGNLKPGRFVSTWL